MFYNYILYYYNFEILKLLISIIIISFIIILLPFISNLLILKYEFNKDKISGYECGFEPFETARSKFNIQYFLTAILFIIFDLEIIFLIPFIVLFNTFNLIIIYFLIILTIGFLYEIFKGALEFN